MDFYFDTLSLDLGGPTAKYEGNLAAIRLLKEIELAGRAATPEEQAILARYVGWGDSALLRIEYNTRWDDPNNLRNILAEEEWDSAKGSTLNAHYTALPVVRAMWNGLLKLGFGNLPKVRVLDPSAGVGHFKSVMPAALRDQTDGMNATSWVEIELDSITARILKLLHPDSKVHALGFEEVNLPGGWFDLAISNAPFGDYAIVDRNIKDARLRACIHDYFFVRTASLLRPGGILAYITSRFTLDKKDAYVRRYLAQQMDLLAAVRLPNTAFKQNAGTEVVTDILIMQKRQAVTDIMPSLRSLRSSGQASGQAWVEVAPITLEGRYGSDEQVNINKIFVEHPDWTLGTPSLAGTMYAGDQYTVEGDGRDVAQAIEELLLEILPENVVVCGEQPDVEPNPEAAPTVFYCGAVSPDTCTCASAGKQARVDALKVIYETAKTLLYKETHGAPLMGIALLRERLNQAYDRFTERYGPISGATNVSLLKDIPALPFLKALEDRYDPLTNSAGKAAIFFRSTVRQANMTVEVKSVQDALLLCLDRIGSVDLEYIARLAGQSLEDAAGQLRGQIYKSPDGRWQTADEYLSGNILAKLREAEAAAELDPAFTENVQALQEAMPQPLKPGEIRASLGAGWIGTDVVGSFLQYLLPGGGYTVSYVPDLARWALDKKYKWGVPSGLLCQRWGTSRRDAFQLVDDALNAHTPVVYDEIRDGGETRRAINRMETVAAQAKLFEIKAKFEEWVWQDEERAAHLAQIYNERFNCVSPRRFDGSHLTLPGLNADITLRQCQMDAVWRILQSPATLLAHEVGMGKTLACLAAVMEAKRLGLSRKAMVVVPNHLTAQWRDQALWAYPNANILCAGSDDLSKARRGEFLSRIATGDWDLVIVPMSSFKLLPVGSEILKEFFQREIDRLENHLWELKKERGKSEVRAIKEIEKALKRYRARLDEQNNMSKDSEETITFDGLGLDLLVVDEHHNYKNLYFHTQMTRIAGLPNADSQRAFDMFVKIRWLLENGGRVVGATGTPVTNTLAEVYTMQRFFQMERLEELEIAHFDAWAKMFALAEPGLEMTPDGAGFRMNTRFRKFVNLPELLKLWQEFADTQMIDDASGIERPDLYGKKPVKVVLPGSQELRDYVLSLAARAERVRSGSVAPEEDNMLKVTGDGRKAALDLSLVIPGPADAPMPKVDTLADIVARIHRASEPTRGAQIIFCDLATPKAR